MSAKISFYSLLLFLAGCGSADSEKTPSSASIPSEYTSNASGSDAKNDESGSDARNDASGSEVDSDGPTREVPDSSTGGNTSAASQPLTSCYKGDEWTCQVEAEIVRLTNELRSEPLQQVYEDSYVVRLWSEEQAAAKTISHDGFPTARRTALKAEFPYATWGFRAENVAMNGRGAKNSPTEVAQTFVTMWENSEGHRKNMLGPYKSIGVGVATDGSAVYATQIFH